LPTPFAKHEKRGRWAWPITAEGKGRANFGPPGAAKKNGWARARRGLEKERLGRGQGQARAAEKERHQ